MKHFFWVIFEVILKCIVFGYVLWSIQIGETLEDKVNGSAFLGIKIEQPTMKMEFSINTSPFVGREVCSLIKSNSVYVLIIETYIDQDDDGIWICNIKHYFSYVRNNEMQIAIIEVPETYVGAVMELLGKCHG